MLPSHGGCVFAKLADAYLTVVWRTFCAVVWLAGQCARLLSFGRIDVEEGMEDEG